MKKLLFISFLLCGIAYGQHGVQLLYEELPLDSNIAISTESHTSLRPLVRWSNNAAKGFIQLGNEKFYIDPAIDLSSKVESNLLWRSGAGFTMTSNFEKKWFLRLSALGGVTQSDSIFIPKTYFSNFDSIGKGSFLDLRARVAYTPNEIFNFQAGLDHNFIGEGSRSLFLSDYGKPYPFGLVRTNFWRIEYSVLYQFMHEGDFSDYTSKFGATHYLSINATKWLNFGVFESVIFQPKDTAMQRGFEVEYLNPVIFYRPQEYSLGSSDNVVLGAAMTVKLKPLTFYGQLVVDEFSLEEIRKKSGWWANKYGVQAGVKSKMDIGKWKSFARLEYNFLRPYTYAHLTNGQNYGNMGQILAHPNGANVMELLGEIKMEKENLLFKLFVSYFLYGMDKDGYSYGSQVYKPYTLRPTEYNHFTGQGLGNNGIRMILSGAYQPLKKNATSVFTECHLRYDTFINRWSFFPVFGLRSRIGNDYRNY
jgi:hypothetical protein